MRVSSGACAPGCPARPFRVGTWVIPRGRGCLFSSRGLRPGLSCSTLSGSSAYSKRASARYAGKYMMIDMDRERLLTVRPLRLIRRSPGTITRRIAKVSRVGNNQRAAGRIRDTIGIGIGIDIDAAALRHQQSGISFARMSIAAAIADAGADRHSVQGAAYCRPHQTPERQRLSRSHGHDRGFSWNNRSACVLT